MRLLFVTAVAAERDALRTGLSAGLSAGLRTGLADAPVEAVTVEAVTVEGVAVEVVAVGVGGAAAAAGTARLLATGDFQAVVAAGIAGGFDIPLGSTVIGTVSRAADLGADSPDGFVPLSTLGFGPDSHPASGPLLEVLRAALPDAVTGPILSVNTVTGTATGTEELRRRHPDAVAEAMEGFGVASAAALFAVPFGELRTISNAVGPRDRSAWRIGDALGALTEAGTALGKLAGLGKLTTLRQVGRAR